MNDQKRQCGVSDFSGAVFQEFGHDEREDFLSFGRR